jgi:hypothetical protein
MTMPDPVWALVSFVLLIVYCIIGAAISGVFVSKLSQKKDVRIYVKQEREGVSDITFGYFFAALGWPVLLAACVVGVFFAAPVWIGNKVCRYVSGVVLEKL